MIVTQSNCSLLSPAIYKIGKKLQTKPLSSECYSSSYSCVDFGGSHWPECLTLASNFPALSVHQLSNWRQISAYPEAVLSRERSSSSSRTRSPSMHKQSWREDYGLCKSEPYVIILNWPNHIFVHLVYTIISSSKKIQSMWCWLGSLTVIFKIKILS